MSIARASLASLCLLAGSWGASGAEQTVVNGEEVSFYRVARAHSPIIVDGKLDELDWQMAEQINGFERILNPYDRVRYPTRARMLWDDQAFYFSFSCQDPDMWAIYDKEDDALWEEEVVEAFIDPDGDAQRYLELEVSPLNAVVDLLINRVEPEFDGDKDWDIAGLQTAVQVRGSVNDSLSTDQGWTVEIAIPWSGMAGSIGGAGKPTPGDQWRLNLYRIDRAGGRNLKASIDALGTQLRPLAKQAAGLREAGNRRQLARVEAQIDTLQAHLKPLNDAYDNETEYTAWSETHQRGFHHPQRFGVVEFLP